MQKLRPVSQASTIPRPLVDTLVERSGTPVTVVDQHSTEALAAANVALVCPTCGEATRVGFRTEPGGTKVRVCKKCGGDL